MNVAIIHNPLTYQLECDRCWTLAFLAAKETDSQLYETGQNKNSTFNFVVIRKYPPSKKHLF